MASVLDWGMSRGVATSPSLQLASALSPSILKGARRRTIRAGWSVASDDVTEHSGKAAELTAQQRTNVLNVPLSYLIVESEDTDLRLTNSPTRTGRVRSMPSPTARTYSVPRGLK